MEHQDVSYYPVDYNLAPDAKTTQRLNILSVVLSVGCAVLCFAVSKDLYILMGVVAVAIILYGHFQSSSHGMLIFSSQGIRLQQKGKSDIDYAAADIQSVTMHIYKEERLERFGPGYSVNVVVMKIAARGQVVERQFELSPNDLDEQIQITSQMVEKLTADLGGDKVSALHHQGLSPMPDNATDERRYIWITIGTFFILLAACLLA